MALPYRPYERRKLEDLLAASRAGLNPDLGYSIFDDIQQGVLDRIAQQRGVRQDRRAVRQDALSGLGQQLTEAALGGVPAEGLEALAGLQATANPMIPERGLDALVGQASTLTQSIPGAIGGPPTPIDQEDLDTIEEDVAAWATGSTKSPDGNPMSLHDATMEILGQLRFLGYSAEDQERVRQFVEMKWLEYGGPPRGSQVADTGAGDVFGTLGAGAVGAGLVALLARRLLGSRGTTTTPTAAGSTAPLGAGRPVEYFQRPGNPSPPGMRYYPSAPEPATGLDQLTAGREPLALPAVGETRPIIAPGRTYGSEPAFTEQARPTALGQTGRTPLMPRALSGLYGVSNVLGFGLDAARAAGLTHSYMGIPNDVLAEYQAAQASGLPTRWNPTTGHTEVQYGDQWLSASSVLVGAPGGGVGVLG